ncbi:MAG TPA: PKD domain-containing protein [Marmoricola sp.]|nr:PKD domain-containing protein [Marmoricola sp.]
MNTNRPLVRLAALGTAASLTLVAGPALAKPAPRPGKVTNVKVAVADIAKANGAYRVPSSWSASTNTTDYNVKLLNSSGTTLDSATGVTSAAWTAHTNAKVGTLVRVVVVPLNGARKGAQAQSGLVPLPDVTAPTGQFTVVSDTDTGNAEVDQVLTDDLSTGADIKETINWGDGAVEQYDGTATKLTHTYGLVEARYVPTVVLSDKAGNTTAPINLDAVVVKDDVAPSGAAYALSGTSAWTGYTPVGLSETAVPQDKWSPADTIVRTVDWGDGTTPQTWTTGPIPTHRYAADGAYGVTVTTTDEAGNTSAPIPAGTVTVTTDATAPKVGLKLPTTPRTYVKKWRYLRGTATDAGVGVKQVRLQVVEKRGSTYYAYKFSTQRWVKAGTRIGQAWTKAGRVSSKVTATHTWSRKVVGLRKGVLTYRVDALDRVGNTSKWLVHSQKLTH